MSEEFSFELRAQREWSWLIVTGFFLAGLGAGLFVLAFFLGLNSISVTAVILTAFGALALLFDLGNPIRAWRAFAHLRTSWISWGITLISIFLVIGLLHALPAISWFSWLPWSPQSGVGYIGGLITMVAAFGVMGYTGFVLAYSPAIPLWNTTLLPILFILYSLMGALGAMFAMSPAIDWTKTNLALLEIGEIVLISLSLVVISVYLLTISYSTVAAKEAVRVLVRGSLAIVFLGGTIVIGLIVPLVLAILVYSGGADATRAVPVLVVAGVMELAGGFLLRYSLVRAGVYVPLI